MTDTTTEGPEIPVHQIHVVDRSSSMGPRRFAVVNGFNSFLAEQRDQPGKCRLTLVDFSTAHDAPLLIGHGNGTVTTIGGITRTRGGAFSPQTERMAYTVHHDAVKIAKIPDLTPANYNPNGNTPLFDAEARAILDGIRREEARAAAGKPAEAVLFVSWTDGQENRSVEYNAGRLAALKAEREAAGWTFIQQAIGFDAREQAAASGTHIQNLVNFGGDAAGVAMAFAGTNTVATAYRSAAKKGARSVLRSASTDVYTALDINKPADDETVVGAT